MAPGAASSGIKGAPYLWITYKQAKKERNNKVGKELIPTLQELTLFSNSLSERDTCWFSSHDKFKLLYKFKGEMRIRSTCHCLEEANSGITGLIKGPSYGSHCILPNFADLFCQGSMFKLPQNPIPQDVCPLLRHNVFDYTLEICIKRLHYAL